MRDFDLCKKKERRGEERRGERMREIKTRIETKVHKWRAGRLDEL